MIRKHASAGIGYSVLDLDEVRHLFAAAVPHAGGSLEQQAADALSTIRRVNEEERSVNTISRQAVFMRDASLQEEYRRIIHDFYGPDLPATTYIVQPPCEGRLIAIEALGIGRGRGESHITRIDEYMTSVSYSGVSWVHCAQVTPRVGGGVYAQACDGFARMREMLATQHVRFEQVVRTWLYLPDITGPDGDVQRYQELNRARTDFFQGLEFSEVTARSQPSPRFFPASTGIGTSAGELVMGCMALVTDRTDLYMLPLENPLQTPASAYAARYSPQSPKFSRGMALIWGPAATIFISGTASITHSETRYVGDAVGQTHQTLDNIAALIAEDNFAQHGAPGLGATLDGLAHARVYLKRPEDYAGVRAAMEQRLGDLPTVYAIADVCRPDLLVEIEGIAYSARE